MAFSSLRPPVGVCYEEPWLSKSFRISSCPKSLAISTGVRSPIFNVGSALATSNISTTCSCPEKIETIKTHDYWSIFSDAWLVVCRSEWVGVLHINRGKRKTGKWEKIAAENWIRYADRKPENGKILETGKWGKSYGKPEKTLFFWGKPGLSPFTPL